MHCTIATSHFSHRGCELVLQLFILFFKGSELCKYIFIYLCRSSVSLVVRLAFWSEQANLPGATRRMHMTRLKRNHAVNFHCRTGNRLTQSLMQYTCPCSLLSCSGGKLPKSKQTADANGTILLLRLRTRLHQYHSMHCLVVYSCSTVDAMLTYIRARITKYRYLDACHSQRSPAVAPPSQ